MDDLLAGRLQMAVSLGFHIVFACIGMVMPFFMAAAHYRYITTKEEKYKILTKSWAKGVAIFFAVGAVSGTMLSFELGMLWPNFMLHAGPIIGMPFSLEGTAFFIEAIALGLFLYGWSYLPEKIHFTTGIIVGFSGLASGILVIAANSWMNSPAGFEWVNGEAINIDPIAAMLNDAWLSQSIHMIIAAFVATGFAVAGVHALQLLRSPRHPLHLSAMKIALAFGGIAALIQPLSGDFSAKDVAERQPAKLAAMEALFETTKDAPLIIGGIPDEETGTVNFALHIPYGLSFLAFGNLHAEVKGLNEFPKSEWPPVLITHFAFQVMVGLGTILLLISLVYFYAKWKRPHWIFSKWFLRILVVAIPFGFIAVEAGWTVTEVGRQPWIIYEVMKTSEALTTMPGLFYTFLFTTSIYLLLTVIVYWLMARQIKVVNLIEISKIES